MRYIVRSVDGDEYGPFTRRELLDLVRDRRLGPGDFVRRESGRTWSPFERIAGLADADASPPSEPAADEDRSLRLEPAPEILETAEDREVEEEEPEDSPIGMSAAPIPADPPKSIEPSPPLPTDRNSDPRPNPFNAVGLPIELDPDEEVRFVLRQSFLDGLRESPIGGLLGHRSTMICTSSRVVVVHPSLARPSMSVVWLTGSGGATIETRRRLIRLLLGVVLLLQAFSLLVSGPIAGALTALIPGANAATATALGGFGLLAGAVLGLFGLFLLLSSAARSLVVASGGAEAVLGCGNAGPWHLAQVDRAQIDRSRMDRSFARPNRTDA